MSRLSNSTLCALSRIGRSRDQSLDDHNPAGGLGGVTAHVDLHFRNASLKQSAVRGSPVRIVGIPVDAECLPSAR